MCGYIGTDTVLASYRAVGVSGTLKINDDVSYKLQYFPLNDMPSDRPDLVLVCKCENFLVGIEILKCANCTPEIYQNCVL